MWKGMIVFTPFKRNWIIPWKNPALFVTVIFRRLADPAHIAAEDHLFWAVPGLGSLSLSNFGRPDPRQRSGVSLWSETPWLIRFSNMCSNVEQKAGRGTDPFSARELVPTSFSDFGRQKGTHKWRLQTVRHVWFSSNSRVCVNCPRHGSLDRCLTKYLIVWPMWVGCTY